VYYTLTLYEEKKRKVVETGAGCDPGPSLNNAGHANRRRVNYNVNTTSPNMGLPDLNNKNPIWKKPILVGDTMFLAIPDSIVQLLHINEEYTWFQEIPTNEGIFFLSKEIG
jgi:hypothetical protein